MINDPAAHRPPRGRFADRSKRLARRQESDIFRHFLMPVAWIACVAGLLGLVTLWVGQGLEMMRQSAACPVLALLCGTPVLIALLRILRGHFHSAVRNL